MENNNYQQPKKNKGLIIGLSAAVVVLLLALVGILAYNFGKSNNEEETVKSENVETVPTQEDSIALVEQEPTAVEQLPEALENHDFPEEPTVDARSLSDLHLEGTIAGKGVMMDLTNYNGTLSGSYYYTRFGDKGTLQLDGTIDGSGRVYLSEYNVNRGYETSYLEGRLSRDGHLTGSFTNSNGNTYRVSLTVQ